MFEFDVIIVGGGIAGCGIAQAASAEGYSVLLLEKNNFGSQTSSHSSKLIHGGLRYLETFQFSLVRESLQQRRELLKLAPTLVKPIPFYVPIYKHSRRGSWTIRAGLSLYSMLAGFERLSRFNTVPESNWHRLSGLNKDQLCQVFRYWDAQTDDQLLTQAVMKSAQNLGAKTACPASFIGADKIHNAGESGFQVQYRENGKLNSCLCRTLINTAGPWVNEVNDKVTPHIEPLPIDWIQGTHVILKHPCPHRIYYLESHLDQRVVFVMPWQGKTMIGTTEKPLAELPQKITPSDAEIEYLLAIYRHYFPHSKSEILTSFAGIRVMPRSTRKAFNRSRDTQLWSPQNHSHYRAVFGGKLTTFRSTAKDTVNWLNETIGQRQKIADIDELRLA